MLTLLTFLVATYWLAILLLLLVAAAVVFRFFIRSLRGAAHLAISDMPPPPLGGRRVSRER